MSAIYQGFPTWNALVGAVGRGEAIWYQAPLDARPVRVRCELRARSKVRVFPPTRDADPFTADAGHLERFKRYIPAREPDEVIVFDDE